MAKLEVHTDLVYTAEVSDKIMKTIQKQVPPDDMANFFCSLFNEILQEYFEGGKITEHIETDLAYTDIYINDEQVY